MPDLVSLYFNRPWQNYGAGEVAGFNPSEADAILKMRRPKADGSKGPIAELFIAGKHALPSSPVPTVVPSDSLVSVQFTQNCGRYRAGEIAGFPRDVAETYVLGSEADGRRRPPVAVYYKEEKPEQPLLSLTDDEKEENQPVRRMIRRPPIDKMIKGGDKEA